MARVGLLCQRDRVNLWTFSTVLEEGTVFRVKESFALNMQVVGFSENLVNVH